MIKKFALLLTLVLGYPALLYAPKCFTCGRVVGSESALIVHNRVHTGERPYECLCGQSFAQTGTFRRHQLGPRCVLFKEKKKATPPLHNKEKAKHAAAAPRKQVKYAPLDALVQVGLEALKSDKNQLASVKTLKRKRDEELAQIAQSAEEDEYSEGALTIDEPGYNASDAKRARLATSAFDAVRRWPFKTTTADMPQHTTDKGQIQFVKLGKYDELQLYYEEEDRGATKK